MSLKISPIEAVPEATARTAHAAFPKGNACLTLRDQIGTLFSDDQFVDLFVRIKVKTPAFRRVAFS